MEILFLNTMNAKMEGIKEYLYEQTRSTDVFCFQEVYDFGREVLEKILSNYNLVFFDKDGGRNLHFGIATFVRKDIDIVLTRDLLDGKMNLGCCVYTKIKKNGQVVHLANTHGIPLPGKKLDNDDRIQQTLEIINYFSRVKGKKIVGGDFNLLPNTRSVCLFAEDGYRNLIEDYKIDTTRNQHAWKYPEKQLFADYVFITPDIHVNAFEVPKNEISDHLPMILRIED